MKAVYLGRKFYRKMFGLVLLIPVVVQARETERST